MIIIECRAAYPDSDVQESGMTLVSACNGPDAGGKHLRFRLGHAVRHVIGRRVALLLQDGEVSLQLLTEDVEQRRRRRRRKRKQ